MQKILAISGGIDSMVMLDFLYRSHPDVAWQVVTVDHGTRPSSVTDAIFVQKIAETRYHLPTHIISLDLGPNISESAARDARYTALFQAAGSHGEIYLAHHLDDLIESITINLLRGTGWRGLAVMNRPRLRRPLLQISADKSWVLRYAARHHITYREDPTNQTDDYLRNRLRPLVRSLPESTKLALHQLWQDQLTISSEISDILSHLPPALDRIWLTSLDDLALDEVLRAFLLQYHITTTHPTRQDLIHALRTYQNGKYFNLPNDTLLKIDKLITF